MFINENELNDALTTRTQEIHETVRQWVEQDIQAAKDQSTNQAAGLDAKITAVDSKLETGINSLNGQISSAQTSLNGTIDTKIAAVEGKLDTGINGVTARISTIDTKITDVEGRLNTGINALSGTIDTKITAVASKLDTGIDALKRQVATIQTSLDATVANIGTFDFAATTTEIAATKKDRTEFSAFWTQQKAEAVILKGIRDGTAATDQDINAFINQRGLDVLVTRDMINQLVSAKAELQGLIKKCDKAHENARMLANLSYAYSLMAVHYKTAREHVTQVIAEKTNFDLIMEGGLAILRLAITTGISALTAGAGGILVEKLIEMLAVGPPKGTFNLVDEAGRTRTVEIADKEDVTAATFKRGVAAEMVKSTTEGSTSAVVDGVITGPITGILSSDEATNTIQDPYDFFIQKEMQLRKAAAYVLSAKDDKVLTEISVELDRTMNLAELKGDPNWKFLFEEMDTDALNEIWGTVSRLLAVNMRRLCWRLWCRSQWKNSIYDYTVTVNDPSNLFKSTYCIGPASDWHYKVWNSTKGGWPRHWEKICSDFKGPEHDPEDPFTVKKGMVNKAHKFLENNTWISMAVVQCCQIRRYRWALQGWDIDLEKLSHFGGDEGEANVVPHGWTDYDLVFAELGSLPGLDAYLQKIRVKGGLRVQISEVRFGAGSAWFKATGKKGRLTSDNVPEAALPIVKNMQMTVMINRTNAHGERARSTVDARVYLYRVDSELQGKKTVLKTHSDGIKCADINNCWYCAFTEEDKQKSDEYKASYRLVRKDFAESNTVLITSEGLNYVSFPASSSLRYPGEPGLYCIRLDPRLEWRQADWRTPQYHVSNTWWFKILDQASGDQVPTPPEITAVTRATSKVSGTYKRRPGEDSENEDTLIHLFVNGKMFGPKTVKPVGDTAVAWEIDCDLLRGGERVTATATWPASVKGRAAQSLEPTQIPLVLAQLPTIDPTKAGAISITGKFTAVEGVFVKVQVKNGTAVEKSETVRLEGRRSAEDANGTIDWSISGLSHLAAGWTIEASVLSGTTVVGSVQTLRVGQADAPTMDPVEAGWTEVSGKSKAPSGMGIEVSIAGKTETYRTILSETPVLGEIEWTVTGLPPLAWNASVTAKVIMPFKKSPAVVASPSTTPAVTPQAITLAPVSKASATAITGTAPKLAGASIRVQVSLLGTPVGYTLMQHAAGLTQHPSDPDKVNWKIDKLKLRGASSGDRFTKNSSAVAGTTKIRAIMFIGTTQISKETDAEITLSA